MNDSKKKFYNGLFISVGMFIFISFLLLFTFSVNASENSDNFPYALDTYKGTIPDSIIDVVISDFRSASGYTGDNFIIFATDTNWTSIFFKVIIDPCFNMPNNINEYSYSSSYYNIYSYSGSNQYNFWYRPDNSAHGQYGSPTANLGYGFGGDTTSSIGFYYTFYPHYPIYMGSDYVYNRFDINASSETVANIGIYKSSLPAVVPDFNTGHAHEPEDNTGNDINTGGHAQQPNTPSFPSFPSVSIDLSSVETILESIFDLVDNFADYVGECFSVFFSWVVSVIQNGLQSIINTLINIRDFLYNNFLDLFEGFFSSFANFFSIILDLYNNGLDENGNFSVVALGTYLFIPEVDDILDIMQENDEYGFIDIIDFLALTITGIAQYIHNVTPTHYINIPSFTIMGVTIPATIIDFSWYNNYKVVGDAIISAFLIVGYIYWLWTRLPGWFRGNSGDIFTENNSDSSNYHGTKIGF